VLLGLLSLSLLLLLLLLLLLPAQVRQRVCKASAGLRCRQRLCQASQVCGLKRGQLRLGPRTQAMGGCGG
jgi:hypothetical protein